MWDWLCSAVLSDRTCPSLCPLGSPPAYLPQPSTGPIASPHFQCHNPFFSPSIPSWEAQEHELVSFSLENFPIYLCFPPAQGDPTNLWELYEVICLSKLTAASGLNFWSVSFVPPSKGTSGCRQQPSLAGWDQHDLPRARRASRGGSGSPSSSLAPSPQCPGVGVSIKSTQEFCYWSKPELQRLFLPSVALLVLCFRREPPSPVPQAEENRNLSPSSVQVFWSWLAIPVADSPLQWKLVFSAYHHLIS